MNFLRRLMYGRYGADQLGLVTLGLYLTLYLISIFTGWLPLYIVSLLLAGWGVFRMVSRNVAARRKENEWFLRRIAPVRRWFRTRKMVHSDKDHKYLKCPQCGQNLRVPRVGGKIKVTCRSCGACFETKS